MTGSAHAPLAGKTAIVANNRLNGSFVSVSDSRIPARTGQSHRPRTDIRKGNKRLYRNEMSCVEHK